MLYARKAGSKACFILFEQMFVFAYKNSCNLEKIVI